jgi:hypothetical protein
MVTWHERLRTGWLWLQLQLVPPALMLMQVLAAVAGEVRYTPVTAAAAGEMQQQQLCVAAHDHSLEGLERRRQQHHRHHAAVVLRRVQRGAQLRLLQQLLLQLLL